MNKAQLDKEIQTELLKNQQVTSLDEITEWFKKSNKHEWQVVGVKRIGDFLISAPRNTPIRICGDYDVDGVMSTYILVDLLRKMGFKDVTYTVPLRHSEHYGLKDRMIDEMEMGILITCDTGITAISQIKKAKGKGLTTIITDHHEPMRDNNGKIILPEADFICNPKAIAGSNFDEYCGAGVCYKIAEYVLKDTKKLIPYQVCAAIATISDVMPLTKENYVIVKNGLSRIPYVQYTSPFLFTLMSMLDMTSFPTSAHDVGFKLGPCINAMSRMYDDGANKFLDMLLEPCSLSECYKNATFVIDTNNKRKELKRALLKEAYDQMERDILYGEIPLVICFQQENVEGLIGIVAGALAEEFNVPTIVFSPTTNGNLIGSARTSGNYNMYDHLSMVKDTMVTFGGHSGAAGLQVKAEEINNFKIAIQSVSYDYEPQEDFEEKNYIEIEEEDVPFANECLRKYGPWGEKNKKPLFKIKNCRLMPTADGQYLKASTGYAPTKIATKNFVGCIFSPPAEINRCKDEHIISICGDIDTNVYKNQETLQITFDKFEFHDGEPFEKTSLVEKLHARANERKCS